MTLKIIFKNMNNKNFGVISILKSRKYIIGFSVFLHNSKINSLKNKCDQHLDHQLT